MDILLSDVSLSKIVSYIDRMSKLYDKLFNRAQTLFKEYNPCDIQCDKDGYISCRGYTACKDNQLCCTSPTCKHWTPIGCSVQSLSCKLWICSIIGVYYPIPSDEFYEKLHNLRLIADHYGLRVFRGTKRDSIMNAVIMRFTNVNRYDYTNPLQTSNVKWLLNCVYLGII